MSADTPVPQQATTDRQHCLNCNAHVTPDFVRVFGPETGPVRACLECATLAALRAGVGAKGGVADGM